MRPIIDAAPRRVREPARAPHEPAGPVKSGTAGRRFGPFKLEASLYSAGMKTIRLPDPFPRGQAARKLEWGSSAWAAESCLVEWSQLEREWLDVPTAEAADGRRGSSWRRQILPALLWGGAAGVGLMLVYALAA